MAVCEIWDVRGRLDHPIDYAENPEKTANPKYTEADLQAMVDVTLVFDSDIPDNAVSVKAVSTSYELLSDEDLEEIFNL